jgi:hypothetical protein
LDFIFFFFATLLAVTTISFKKPVSCCAGSQLLITRAVSTKNIFCMQQIVSVTASVVKEENKKMPYISPSSSLSPES